MICNIMKSHSSSRIELLDIGMDCVKLYKLNCEQSSIEVSSVC